MLFELHAVFVEEVGRWLWPLCSPVVPDVFGETLLEVATGGEIGICIFEVDPEGGRQPFPQTHGRELPAHLLEVRILL